MRMSDEEYFRSCVSQERHLAQLRGHQNIEEFYESAGSLWENAQVLPKWTRDWKACGLLIAEYALTINYQDLAGDSHGKAVVVGATVVHISDHPNLDQAIRYAIVKAAITHLERAKHGKH